MVVIHHIKTGIVLLGLFLFGIPLTGSAQLQYQDAPALQIIDDIEQRTPFRFLYRDALLTDITLSFSAENHALFSTFRDALQLHKLSLKVDSSRHQVIIFKQKQSAKNPKKISVRGQVVDAATGERLPFANIIWAQGSRMAGVSANQSGSFHISQSVARNSVRLRASYIGYAPKTITLPVANLEIRELTFRLQPKRIDANELIITGNALPGSINPKTNTLVDIGTFSPLGDANSLRALQTLPSVSVSPAMSDGLHVRGSPTDGFQVLLDEIPIYNQTHLFGLLDSFNADILQRNSLFYDVAPARFQAPPGGTLSLDTQSGSLNKFSATAGISNAAARLTLSGPIKQGSSSWLISGRKSYLNSVHWLNSENLVAWGLNVDREKQVLDNELVDFESQLVQPHKTDASFYDLHGKVYVEGTNGSRLILSGYFGGDDTRQTAQRLFESFSMPGDQQFDRHTVSTKNNWHNGAGSIQYQQWLTDDLYTKSTAGGSFYQTAFSKEDFSYTSINRPDQSLENFIYPFENESILNEIKAEQMLEYYAGSWILTGGLSYHYYMGEYYEDSFDRPGYYSPEKAHQLDVYSQIDYTGLDILDIFAGTRLHYYSNGQYLRWSPRIKFKLFTDSKVSVGAGYSRNHQFLNQVNLNNTVTADVWVLANKSQQPTSVDYFSGGLYLDLSDHLYAQVEGYIKEFEHLRLHELDTYSLAGSFGSNPWLTNNSGSAKGIELLLRNRVSFIDLSQTFTVSEVLLSNPAINDGKAFYADWDRRYQYNVTLNLQPTNHLSLYLSWVYASGTPNKLAIFGAQNDAHLDAYRRADVSAEYKRSFSDTQVSLSLTVYNVLDRQNPWYRELAYVIDRSTSPDKFKNVPVDVYDIGLQPSFNISVTF